MDPVSISASAAGIAALAGTIIKNVAQFVAGVSNADESLAAFHRIVSELEQVLENLGQSFDEPSRPKSLGNCQRNSVRSILSSCNSYLYIIKRKIPNCQDDAGAIQRTYNQVKAYLQSSLVFSIQSRLQMYTQMLQLSLTEVVVVGQRENKRQYIQIRADLQDVRKTAEEIRAKFKRHKRILPAGALERGLEGEMEKEMLQIESRADNSVEEWISSTSSLADMSEKDFDLASLDSRQMSVVEFDAKSDISDFDPEPEREDFLPLDMMTSLIERLQRQARNKMKARMFCRAEQDQRRAIQLLEQRERFHKRPFSDRADLEEVLAEILFKMNTLASFDEAKKILQRLLQEEKESSARRSRLYHLLAEMYSKQGKLVNALKFATRAFSERKALPEEQSLINETAKLTEEIYRSQGDFAAAAVVRESIVENKSPTSLKSNSLHSRKASEEEFYKWLGDHGYDTASSEPIDPRDPATGRSLIQQAISMENAEIVDFILHEFSFTLESRDANGATPLLLAAAKKNSLLVDRILQHDPDTAATDRCGDTALHSVQSSNGGVKAADLLLSHHTPVRMDQRNHESKTALHLAVGLGNVKMVELLLSAPKKADVNAKTQTGRTPLHVGPPNPSLNLNPSPS